MQIDLEPMTFMIFYPPISALDAYVLLEVYQVMVDTARKKMQIDLEPMTPMTYLFFRYFSSRCLRVVGGVPSHGGHCSEGEDAD